MTTETKKEVYLAFPAIPRVREGNNFEIVDQAIEVVKEVGVPCQVAAMETTMRGDLDHLLVVVERAQQRWLDAGAVEVTANIKIHTRTADASDTFCTYDRGVTTANHMFVAGQSDSL